MEEKYEYIPNGVCSRKMIFTIENNIVKDLVVIGGCSGNLQGITKLISRMTCDEVINKLKNTKCGMESTSCPDQLAKALEEYKKIKV